MPPDSSGPLDQGDLGRFVGYTGLGRPNFLSESMSRATDYPLLVAGAAAVPLATGNSMR